MKDKAIVPTGVERPLRKGEYIISTTDMSGRITSANGVLVDYTGYTAEKLLRLPHRQTAPLRREDDSMAGLTVMVLEFTPEHESQNGFPSPSIPASRPRQALHCLPAA